MKLISLILLAVGICAIFGAFILTTYAVHPYTTIEPGEVGQVLIWDATAERARWVYLAPLPVVP